MDDGVSPDLNIVLLRDARAPRCVTCVSHCRGALASVRKYMRVGRFCQSVSRPQQSLSRKERCNG